MSGVVAWYAGEAGLEGVPSGWAKRTLAKVGHEDAQEALERARARWPDCEVQLLGRQRFARWRFMVRRRA